MGTHKGDRRHGHFWGLLFIIVGGLFFLGNIGLIDVGDLISTLWPLVLIFIGLWIVLKSKGQGPRSDGGVHSVRVGRRCRNF
ncbi:MAG: LiaI-LiaF-like domain-containing protein [bacterium]